MSAVVERLRGSQGWDELESPPEIRLPFDLKQVISRHYPQGTKDLLGPNLVTLLDDNEVIVDKGSVSTDLSATTWAGQASPSHVEWTWLGSEDGRGGNVGAVREQRQRGGSGQSTRG